MTHTIPWPPPGTGVALICVEALSVAGAGAGVFFGLNRLPKSGLAGDAVGEAAGGADASAFLRPRVFAGEADASGLAIGAGEVSAFLRPRVLAGDAEASGLVAGEVSAFLRPRFFAGEADASGLALGGVVGLCASTRQTQARMVISKSRARLVVMKGKLEARPQFRQR